MRPVVVLVHRYVGLVMAGFLLIAGLTGSLLVWYHELDAALNPRLMRVNLPAALHGVPPAVLDPLVLRDRVRAAYPQAQVNYLSFHQASPTDARTFYLEPAAGAAALEADEVFVDPYTGTVLGARRWGDITQGVSNLMPFIYRLHYSLALDVVGTWVFGVVALLWTIDCLVGAWLTLPPASTARMRRAGPSWWARWRPAWSVRWRSGSFKLHFDLHRAGGLWPWALLLVLAWSSVAFNLHEPVYRPVMGVVFDLQADPRQSLAPLPQPQPEPALGWPQALAAARARMQEQAHLEGFTVLAEDRVSYDPQKGYLRYVARTDRDINERRGQSAVFVNGRDGAFIGLVLPTGQASGDTVTSWLTTLHMAHIWGLPFRLAMTAMGMAVVLLSVTGVVIWWRKRKARRTRAALQRPPLCQARPTGTLEP